MARRPRIWVVEEEQEQAVAEIKALAELLPVTDIPDDGVPVDVQISIRDDARDLLERHAATPERADSLWEPLPSIWRTQWRRQFAPSPLPNVRRMRAVDPDCRTADDFQPERLAGQAVRPERR